MTRARGRARRALIGAALAAALAGCAGRAAGPAGGPETPPALRVEPRVLGEWELVRFEVSRDGQTVARAARGRLTYDEFANIAVRVELLPDDPEAAPPRVVLLDFTAKAALDAGRGEVSYIGVQTRVSSDEVAPGAVDPREWRRWALAEPELQLSAVDAAGRVRATLVWRRAAR